MTLSNDTFNRPGNYWIGAGVVFFDDGAGELPIVESSDVTLTVEAETVERWDGYAGPIAPVDLAVYAIRRRLNLATVDISPEHLSMLLGATSIESVSSSPAVLYASPVVGRWYQATPVPMPMDSMSIITDPSSTVLVENTDYRADYEHGRIQLLQDPGEDIVISASISKTTETVSSEGVPTRGAIRFIPDELAGDGWSIYSSSAIIRPLGSIEPKSRQWVSIPLEIELLNAVFSRVPQP